MNARAWFYSTSFHGNAGSSDPYPEREWCPICGWRKGGKDSWDGMACKCGHVLPEPKAAK